MATPEGKVPVLAAVSAAWSFARTAAPRFAPAALGVGLVAAGLDLFVRQANAGGDVGGGLFGWALLSVVSGFLYAGYLRFARDGAFGRLQGLDAGRAEGALLAAMTVVAFFLFIVFVVGLIPGVVLLFTAWAPFLPSFEAAGQDQVAMAEAVATAVQGAPGPVIVLALVYGFVWMALTSRLYLVAPASVASARPRTFETWVWTRGNMLRIIAARLLALLPAALIVMTVPGVLLSLAGGGAPEGGAALVQSQPLVAFAALAVAHVLSFLTVFSAEAGLSDFLYRGLKPPSEP